MASVIFNDLCGFSMNVMNNKLSDKEILYFYSILHFVENKIKKGEHKGYNIDNKCVRKFMKNKHVRLDYKNKPCAHLDKNLIVFKTGSDSTCPSFFKHVRNAFAHGGIYKDKNMYIIKDIYRNKITMYGYIGQKLLKELIEVMKSTKSK